ncbi:MAG TPA: hypothetical protein ENJ17_03225 [Gammaproteobacteria bacterium]|nr:hypothetical protein [Gammaproteobacteria bacterium]
MMRAMLLVVLSGLLLACAGDDAVLLGPQQWDDARFIVESRPSPIRRGMTEFIVIATRDKSRPGVGFVVSLQASKGREWRQAIQDGYTGVYRRAVWVEDPLGGRLAVHVKKKDGAETTLYFPFPTAAGAS